MSNKWITQTEFKEKYQTTPLCAYVAMREEHKDHVCGQIPINDLTEPNRLMWRCTECSLKEAPFQRVRLAGSHLWISLEQYVDVYHYQNLCAYMPARGENKGKVCGVPCVNSATETDRLQWRCQNCAMKMGMITKSIKDVKPLIVLAKKPWECFQISFDEYEKEYLNTPMCGYMATKGVAKDKVCGQTPVNTSNPVRLDWRCQMCISL